MRVGWGFDAHAFGGQPPTLLAGVTVDPERGVVATSDGDVAAHAVADALLGATALGDLGELFPSKDEAWRGANSMEMLAAVVEEVRKAGFTVGSVDLTIIAEDPRVSPHRGAIRAALATVLGVAAERVSVKATTTDGLGFSGRGEGIVGVAVAVVTEAGTPP